jgi:hypothetical protein
MQILEPITKFSLDRGIRAFEWLQAALLTIWGLVMLEAHRSDAPRVGLYGAMLNFLPWWVWTLTAFAIVALIASAALFRRRQLLYISIFGKLIYWTTIGVLTYTVATSWLVPSMFFTFAVAAALRYGEVKYEARRDG